MACAKATLKGSSFPRARRLRRYLPWSVPIRSLGALREPRGNSATDSMMPMSQWDSAMASSSVPKRSRLDSWRAEDTPEPDTGLVGMADATGCIGGRKFGGLEDYARIDIETIAGEASFRGLEALRRGSLP